MSGRPDPLPAPEMQPSHAVGTARSTVLRRTVQGLLLSTGAPLGWLWLRAVSGVDPRAEIAANAWLYLYMFGATALAFTLFGAFGGWREVRLEQLATTDALTGLRNYGYFQQRLHEAVAAVRRHHESVGLAILDIDHFKHVNDQLGHAVGDRVLRSVGRAMREQARAGETAARIGGEEFALILPGADLPATHEAAERIRRAASVEVAGCGALPPSWHLTLSAGIAAADTRCSPESLFVIADRALYRAKEEGRDRVVAGGGGPDRPPTPAAGPTPRPRLPTPR